MEAGKIFNKNNLTISLHRLQSKLRRSHQHYVLRYHGIPFASIYLHQRSFLKALEKDLKQQKYKMQPVRMSSIQTEDKLRHICIANILDRIVQGALYLYLEPIAAKQVSRQVYSYQAGRSCLDAISAFKKHVQRHEDLFVIKLDISSYSENMLVKPESDLWALVDKLISALPEQTKLYIKQQIKNTLHPTIEGEDGVYQNIRGVSVGSAINPLIVNLYLCELDRILGQVEGAFYARYADDILFSHPDQGVVEQNFEIIQSYLSAKQLPINNEKTKLIAFNRSCKKHGQESQFKGSHVITYLGYDLFVDKTMAKKNKSRRKILHDIRLRIRNTLNLCKGEPRKKQGQWVCEMLKRYYLQCCREKNNRLYLFLFNTNNRHILKHYDYLIALYIAEALSKRKGPRAFRQIPYKTIRSDWGLPAFCMLKNQLGR